MGVGPYEESFAESLDRESLEQLKNHWGDAYDIKVIDGVWQATRRDGLEDPLEATGPEGLTAAIRKDYGVRPVPRGENPYPDDDDGHRSW